MIALSMPSYFKTIILTIQTYFWRLFGNNDLKLYSINDIKDIFHFRKTDYSDVKTYIQENAGKKVD